MNRPVRWSDRSASHTLLPILLCAVLAACPGAGDGKSDAAQTTGRDTVPPTPAQMAAKDYGAACTPAEARNAFFSIFEADSAMLARFDVREFHDCQRLPVDVEPSADPVYSPVLQIWAYPVTVDIANRPYGDAAAGYRVAVVSTWGTGDRGEDGYSPLGIRAGIQNCLYIKRMNMKWEGVIGNCGAGVEPTKMQVSDRMDLVGHVTRVPPTPGRVEIPSVARWDRGITHPGPPRTVGFIGVRCGDDLWCRFGPIDATPVRSDCGVHAPWCDEQFLALAAPAGHTSPIRPARRTHATVIPAVGLEALDSTAFECRGCSIGSDRGWIPVATASMRSEQTGAKPDAGLTYQRKLNLLGEGPQPSNQIFLRSVRNARDSLLWQAKVVSKDGTARGRWVARHDHAGVDVPGTARWAWSEQDEGVWVRCGSGCCTVTDYAFDL